MQEFLRYIYCMCVGFAWIKEASTGRLPDITIENSKALSPKKIMLTWKSSFTPKRGQLEYIVRYKSKGGTYQRTFIKGTEIMLKGLVPDTEYIVYVRAVNTKARGEWSEPVHVKTKARHAGPNNDIVCDITVAEVNERSVVLKWNSSRDIEDIKDLVGKHFILRCVLDQRKFQLILKSKDGQQKSKTNDLEIQLLDLIPDTSYAANLYIVQGTGKKIRVGRTKFQTLELQRTAPKKLKVKAVTHRSIAVKWKYIKTAGRNDSVTGYVIQYKHRGSTNTQSCSILLDNTRKSYKIQGLLADVKYSVRVSGQFRNITGPFTEWLRIKTAEYSPDKPDVTVYHTSPTSVLLLWSPFSEANNISSVSAQLVTTEEKNLFVTQLIISNKRDYELEVDSSYMVLKDLLPHTKYRTTITFHAHAHCTYYKMLDFITVDGKFFEDCSFRTCNETTHKFESYLRIIPLHDDKYLVTWQPYVRFHNNKDFTYIITVLGKPFLYQLSTHLIPINQRYKVLDSLRNDTTYTINLQVFNYSSGGQPLLSQYLLVMPDIFPDRVETNQVVKDANGLWQATSMDIIIDKTEGDDDGKLFDNGTGSFDVQDVEGTNLTLVSKLYVEESWDMDNISLTEQERPRLNMMNDVTTREEIPLDITCFAQGDPYPSLSLLNISSNESIRDEDSRMNRTVSVHVTDANYVGSTSVVDGRAFMASRNFISFTNLTPWDSGQYACAAENIAGSNTSVFRIKVTPKPPRRLKDLNAQPLTPFEMKVEWEPPEDPGLVRGYHVTIMDEYDVILREQNTSETVLKLDDMEPNTMYHINVAAFHQYEEGEGTVIHLETPGIPVLGPPLNISMRTLNRTTIQVSWQPPLAVLERRIHLRGFIFHHRVVGSIHVEDMQLDRVFTNVSIIGLVPDSKYEARVIAMSEDGQVSHSTWIQGNTSRESYMNESLPPPPPNNVFLKLQRGNIIVSWFPPYPEENILVRGYTINVYHNNTKLQALEVGHKESSVIIYDVEMGVLYRISVQARNRAGTSIQRLEELKIPVEYVTQTPVENFRGIAMSATKLELTWDPPVSGTFSRFVLSYTLAGDIKPELPGGGNLPASVRNYIVRSLQPYTGYVFNITPCLKNFRGVTSSTTVTTLTDKPTAPPTNISLAVINSTTIVIRCFPPEFGKNGPIIQYRVAYRDKRNLRNNILTDADDAQENLNFYINGLEHSTVYEIRVRALTVNGSGPWSPWLQEKTEKREPVLSKVARNLTVTATDTSITITWRPPEQHISELTGYVLGLGRFIPEVYRTSVTRDKTSFTFTELEPESVFIVSVRSFNDFGESAAVFELVNTLSRSTV